MLRTAIDAQLPIIALFSRDPLNLPATIKFLTGRTPVTYSPEKVSLKAQTVYLYNGSRDERKTLDLARLYSQLVKHESSLLLVNPDKVTDIMFNAGEVPVPRQQMLELLLHVVDNQKLAEGLLKALGGCTIKEAVELARLTMAREKSLTPQGVTLTRKQIFRPQQGLTLIDSHQDFYQPQAALEQWVECECEFFLSETDPRLIPRGLLFDGPPGTGKTAGAKYIADQWGVPLYRLDISSTKGKYVGQSEHNLMSNLQQVDHAEPCIMLIDECEKVLGVRDHHDSGTTSGLLSQILWWLAEHRSRVLTVMTTNDVRKIPKELYRERRIDKVMTFTGLTGGDIPLFARAVGNTFPQLEGALLPVYEKMFPQLGAVAAGPLSHAFITEVVIRHIKNLAG